MLPLIIDVNDPEQNGLIADFKSQGTASLPQSFNQDAAIEVWIRPVIENTDGTRTWDEDYLSDDDYYLTIGNPDDKATGGTFTLTGALGTCAAVAYNVSAAALQTAISTVVTSGACTVTLLSVGVYQIDWTANGAVAALTSSATLLQPACEITTTVVVAGSAGTKAQQVIEIRQSPMIEVTFTTEYAADEVSTTVIVAPTATSNSVQQFSFGS